MFRHQYINHNTRTMIEQKHRNVCKPFDLDVFNKYILKEHYIDIA